MKKFMLILLVLTVVIGGVLGYRALRGRGAHQTANGGGQHYAGATIAFDYSPAWSVVASDAGSVRLRSPEITPNVRLDVQIITDPVRSGAGKPCRENCTIYHIEPVAPKNASGAKLVISDWDSQQGIAVLELTGDPQAGEGNATYTLGATVNGKAVRLSAAIVNNQGATTPLPREKLSEVTSSVVYRQLVDIATSLAIH